MIGTTMQARLKVVQDNANLKQVKLLPVTLIGRSPECHLKIASAEVSRKHCRITVTDHDVLIEDLNSSNGTFVNHERIPPARPIPLPPGTHLDIGPARFIVDYTPPVTLETMPTTVLKSHDVARPQGNDVPIVTTQPLSQYPAQPRRISPPSVQPLAATSPNKSETTPVSASSEPLGPPSTALELSADLTVATNNPVPKTATPFPVPTSPGVGAQLPMPESFDFAESSAASNRASPPDSTNHPISEKKSLFGFLSRKKKAPPAAPQPPFDFLGNSTPEPSDSPRKSPAPTETEDPFAFLKEL